MRPWEKLKNLESWELAGLWIIYWDRTPYIISPDLYNSSCRAKADSNNCQLNTIFSLSSLSLIRKLTKSLLEYSWSRVLPNVFALRDYTLGTTPQFCSFYRKYNFALLKVLESFILHAFDIVFCTAHSVVSYYTYNVNHLLKFMYFQESWLGVWSFPRMILKKVLFCCYILIPRYL